MSPNPNAPTFSFLEEFQIHNETRLIDQRGLVQIPYDVLRKSYKIRVLFRLFNPPTFLQYTNKSSNPEEGFYGYATPVYSPDLSTSDFEYVTRETKIPIKYPSQIIYAFTDDSKLHCLLHYLYHQNLLTLLNQDAEPPNYSRFELAIHPCIISGFKVLLLGDTKGEFVVQVWELRGFVGGVPVTNPTQAQQNYPLPAPRDGRDPTPNERDEPGSPALDGVNDNGQTFNPEVPEPPDEPVLVSIQVTGTFGTVVTETGQQVPSIPASTSCGESLSIPAPTVYSDNNWQGIPGYVGWTLEFTRPDGGRQKRFMSDGGPGRTTYGSASYTITPC